jgi:hypothetical protein
MENSVSSAVVDSITRISAGAAGILGVENSDHLVQMVDQSGALMITHQPPHDWITPLIQGVIAIFTIIFQWRSGRRKKSLNDQIRKY